MSFGTEQSAVTNRLMKFRSILERLGLDAFVVTFKPHLRYLSGFSGSSGMGIVNRRSLALVTDGRYSTQVKEETTGWRIAISKGTPLSEVAKQKFLKPGWRVGVDGNTLSYSEYGNFKQSFPGVRFRPTADVIDELTAVKDDAEVASLEKAVRITDNVFNDLLELLKPGVTESDISAEITYRQRRYGAEGDAFEPIVAAGARGAMPHARATANKIRRGEMLTLDFGCIVDGYHSDMTRTVSIGKPPVEMRKVYQVVLDAQTLAADAAAAGKKTREVDAVARQHIASAGFGKYFQHSLGHGVGLQIHEAPRLSKLSTGALRTGNVVTIEPGVYIPGLGGVRIEDVVVIADGGSRTLTRSPKNLIVL
jgi:Xaa-Pro aminopeptidase